MAAEDRLDVDGPRDPARTGEPRPGTLGERMAGDPDTTWVEPATLNDALRVYGLRGLPREEQLARVARAQSMGSVPEDMARVLRDAGLLEDPGRPGPAA